MKLQKLVISHEVLRKLQRYRQRKGHAPEVGGQLFASIDRERVYVQAASEPHPTDVKHRFGCVINNTRCNKEILKYFKSSLHYVGDWHTHPQEHPIPSERDIYSIRESFLRTKHQLNFFVMIIVGTGDMDFYVALVNGNQLVEVETKKSKSDWFCKVER